MSNNFLSAFACITVIGFSAALLPRLAAPSDSYISESLEPTEEPFYITLQPDNYYGSSGHPILLQCRSNIDDVSYTWEVRSSNSSWATVSSGASFIDNCLSFSINTSSSYFRYYRCCISYGDRTIYSAPCLVFVSSSSQSFLLKSDFDEFEKDVEFEESEKDVQFEKTEVFEENERSVENAE